MVQVPRERAIDIDTEYDFKIAEFLMREMMRVAESTTSAPSEAPDHDSLHRMVQPSGRSLQVLQDLRGRVTLLTGGGGHIAAALAEGFAELGADLVLLDRDESALEAVATRLRASFGCRVLTLVEDLEAADDDGLCKRIPERVEREFARLDVLVNCAAFVGTTSLEGWCVPLAEQSVDTWRRCMEVNLTAAFGLTLGCLPLLAVSGHGSIINIGSIYGVVGPVMSMYEGDKFGGLCMTQPGTGMGNPAAYAASKGGLIQLTRYLSTVLAPQKVRVNAICPGGVWRQQDPAFVARYVANTPMGRMAIEEDLKGVAALLATDQSLYITGQNIMVDGGWSSR